FADLQRVAQRGYRLGEAAELAQRFADVDQAQRFVVARAHGAECCELRLEERVGLLEIAELGDGAADVLHRQRLQVRVAGLRGDRNRLLEQRPRAAQVAIAFRTPLAGTQEQDAE